MPLANFSQAVFLQLQQSPVVITPQGGVQSGPIVVGGQTGQYDRAVLVFLYPATIRASTGKGSIWIPSNTEKIVHLDPGNPQITLELILPGGADFSEYAKTGLGGELYVTWYAIGEPLELGSSVIGRQQITPSYNQALALNFTAVTVTTGFTTVNTFQFTNVGLTTYGCDVTGTLSAAGTVTFRFTLAAFNGMTFTEILPCTPGVVDFFVSWFTPGIYAYQFLDPTYTLEVKGAAAATISNMYWNIYAY